MAMQIGTIRKINNFKALMGDKTLLYDEIISLIEAHKNEVPSWTTLRKYGIIDVVRVERYDTEAEDTGDALLWNGWYQWNAEKKVWIIDHIFNLYGLV